MSAPVQHALQLHVRSIAYGGADMWATCTHPQCGDFHVTLDTDHPLLSDLIELNNTHVRACTAEWAGGASV